MLKEAQRELTFYEAQSMLGTMLVGVNQIGVVFAEPGQRRAIATCGLGECTAVAIQFEKLDNPNIHGGIIAHYQPFVVSRLNVENGIRVGSHEALELEIVAKALIISLGEEDPKSPTGHSPRPGELERIQVLTAALKRIFGEKTPVSKVGYRPPRNHGWITDLPEPRERGTVIVEYGSEHPIVKVDGFEIPQAFA